MVAFFGERHARQAKLQEPSFFQEIDMASQYPLAQREFACEAPPSNGLIMTDLTQDAIAFREQLDHFWNKFVL